MKVFELYFYWSAIIYQGSGYAGKPKLLIGVFGVTVPVFVNLYILLNGLVPKLVESTLAAIALFVITYATLTVLMKHNNIGVNILYKHRDRGLNFFMFLMLSILFICIIPALLRGLVSDLQA